MTNLRAFAFMLALAGMMTLGINTDAWAGGGEDPTETPTETPTCATRTPTYFATPTPKGPDCTPSMTPCAYTNYACIDCCDLSLWHYDNRTCEGPIKQVDSARWKHVSEEVRRCECGKDDEAIMISKSYQVCDAFQAGLSAGFITAVQLDLGMEYTWQYCHQVNTTRTHTKKLDCGEKFVAFVYETRRQYANEYIFYKNYLAQETIPLNCPNCNNCLPGTSFQEVQNVYCNSFTVTIASGSDKSHTMVDACIGQPICCNQCPEDD